MPGPAHRALALLCCLSCGTGEGIVGINNPSGGPPDLNVALDPEVVVLPAGETAQFTISTQGTASGTWQLGVSALPAGVVGVFDPPAVAAGQQAVLSLTADAAAPAASAAMEITLMLGESAVSAQGTIVVQLDGAGGGAQDTGGGAVQTDACSGYAAPGTSASCSCAAGHTCSANGCYGGWFCNRSTTKCVAPPSGCASGAGGGAAGSGGGSATGGGSSPGGGAVGPTGGTVPLLHFAVTGDTRPPNCEDTPNYPTSVINGIADAFEARQAQFVVDLGDHMYVCNNSSSVAQTQMNLYMQSVRRFSRTWFMTMGNHECTSGPCLLSSTNANYRAFMGALGPISSKPYYSFSVSTSLGRAVFVIVADNAWDSAQSSWLNQVLTEADANAKYTLVFRHHPEGDTSVSTNATSMALIRQHRFAMFLSGHTHTYKHMTTDNGRDLVIGLGGAPLIAAGSTWHGYAMIDQQQNGQLQVTVYDLAGTVHDTWSVGPN